MGYMFYTATISHQSVQWSRQLWRALVVLLAASFSSIAVAEEAKKVCNQQPSDCVAVVDKQQQSLDPQSPAWWELELVKLTSLLKFQKGDELYVALRPWVDNPDVPANYQPDISMLYGKWLSLRGRYKEAKSTLEQALKGYQALNQQSSSMSVQLKTLNVLVILDRFDDARVYAQELIDEHYDSPAFYREVYTEVAHIAYKTGHSEDHVRYREEALSWAKETNDEQQTAVAYNNYGVALRNSQRYHDSEQAFLAGIECAERAGDAVHVHKMMLRVAELAYLTQDFKKAQQWLGKIDPHYFPPGQIVSYRKLSNKVRTELTKQQN